MRAGGCAVQQALTTDAASIVKQAVILARRRGHAQVTPLHVANAMLSSPAGLLRAACLQSHSHPLQCKALELCFNVALNRLPASASSGPVFGPHRHPPALSNALVAALKRAQAHQRRGSVESQQQPLLAVKIELEQLIISILDDPSVSRVMREAGFSSTQVKANVEQAVSSETCHRSTPSKPKEISTGSSTAKPPSDEDVMSVVESLASRRKRSVAVVGECLATAEGVVRGVMDRVEKNEVPEALRSLQLISLPLSSFKHMGREEVEQKVVELRCLARSCCVGRGAVLYVGDLKWAAEFRARSGERPDGYCPVEHVMMEIGRLVCGSLREGSVGRFWLVGIATYQTYMKCRGGHPSLETVWGLHPLPVPAGSLGLSLSCDSDSQSLSKSKRSGTEPLWSLMEDGVENQLSCCSDCSAKFQIEARNLSNISTSSHGSLSSSLPSWIRQYKEENKRATSNDQECIHIKDLCKKWNSICNSLHKHHYSSEMTPFHFSSSSPSSSVCSYNQHYISLHHPLPVHKHPWREHRHWMSGEAIEEGYESPLLSGNPKPDPNSTSSSDTMEMEYLHKFKELSAENLKTLCIALEKKVSWQTGIIPEIASTVLQCRSGMMKRKEKSVSGIIKEETWLFFHGGDVQGKEKIARELANLVFGSYASFASIGLSNFSSTRSDSTEDLRNKRSRSEVSNSYLERFVEAIRNNPHRVIVMEDIEQVDYHSQIGIKTAIERGRILSSDGDDLSIGDAIVILSCESFDSRSRACSPPVRQKSESEDEQEECEREVSLDLNICAGDEDFLQDCNSFDDVGLVEVVDRAFFFKLPEEL